MNDHDAVFLYNPFIPKNIIYLQFFEDNIQIKDFMQVQAQFENLIYDEESE